MIRVGIVGGTGYTGVELLRILALHPQVELVMITSRSEAGTAVADMFPNLRGHVDLTFSEPELEQLSQCDLVFFATPNGTAMKMVPQLLEKNVKVVDLAADFRFKDAAIWKQWYCMDHACPELLEEAVYGLPELHRDQIKTARLVANPGCYPTAVTLGYLPLIEQGLVDLDYLIADTKSGISGAGRKAAVPLLMGEAGESFKAYNVQGHRHQPEICQNLQQVAGQPIGLSFVPHLLPMIRGIHATLYGRITSVSNGTDMGAEELQSLYEKFYANEPFVDVMPAGSHPETRSVRGVNTCRIAVHQPMGGDTVVVLSVIDNLVKGAAGQAVQNMNLMSGFAETAGLQGIALLP